MAFDADGLLIKTGESIYNAIRVVDLNRRCTGIVVDENKKLLGIVTDSDVRRAIIKGVDVHSPVDGIMCREPLVVTEPINDESVVSLIQNSRFQEVLPRYVLSVNADFQPVNLYDASELISVDILKGFPFVSRKPTKVLLLGGAGYIGSMLSRKLLDAGYGVTILDRFLYGDYPIKDLMKDPKLTAIKGDTRHIDVLVPAIKESGAVVHLAELVGDPLCALDPQTTYEINYLATATVTRICSDLQVNKYIYLSSCSVYGSSSNSNRSLVESSPLAPVSLYARMKINAERVILGTDSANFSPCILRLGTVFGMSNRPRFDLVTNALTAKAITEGKINIFGGEQWRPHVHVDDVAQAIKLVLEAPIEVVKNQVFNIVAENMKIIDVGRLVAGLIPNTEMVVAETGTDARNYSVSGQKASKVLGFKPSMKVRDGVLEIAESLRSGRVKNFADPKYHNYKSQFMGSNPCDQGAKE